MRGAPRRARFPTLAATSNGFLPWVRSKRWRAPASRTRSRARRAVGSSPRPGSVLSSRERAGISSLRDLPIECMRCACRAARPIARLRRPCPHRMTTRGDSVGSRARARRAPRAFVSRGSVRRSPADPTCRCRGPRSALGEAGCDAVRQRRIGRECGAPGGGDLEVASIIEVELGERLARWEDCEITDQRHVVADP